MFNREEKQDREKQVILSIISSVKGWQYITVKRLSSLLREIMSKEHGDFYFLNCLHSFAIETCKRESHKKVSDNKDFCNIVMPSEGTKTLEFNQNQESVKAPFVIYIFLECLIEKIDGCKNNSENLSKPKVGQHIALGFSVSTLLSLKE